MRDDRAPAPDVRAGKADFGETTNAKSRPLTILAIGYAQSPHVQSRVKCFAELGHKVFLLTETAAEPVIAGVTQLVPAPSAMPPRMLGAISWACRTILRFNSDHAWRAAAMLKFLRAIRPDIVHVHFAYAYYGWMAAFFGCRPLVVTVMGGDIQFNEQGEKKREGIWMTLRLLESADYITSKSDYLTSVLDKLGGFGSKAERVYWGLPLDKFRRKDASALRASLGLAVNRRTVLSPRILQPLYQIHLIVEAMQHVVKRHPDALLLITEYGADPDYRAQLVDRIDALNLGGHVRFCGVVAYERMPEYYWASDIAVSMARSDGMPQTLLEAMACQTPTVLNKLPHYQEIVQHEVSGYFVDTDPVSIGEGINRLLAEPELREKITRAALQIAQQRADLDAQARHVERRYRELVAADRRRVFRLGHFLATGFAFCKMCVTARR